MDIARERPMTAALGAAAAVGAGVFLWSRRNQISEQLSELSDQFVEWRDSMSSQSTSDLNAQTDFTGRSDFTTGKSTRQPKRKSQRQVAEEALTLKQTGETEPTGI